MAINVSTPPGDRQRKLYSESEKKALCHRFRLSGLSLRQFCEEHDLPKSSFYGWCQRYREEESDSAFSAVISAKESRVGSRDDRVPVELSVDNRMQVKVLLREEQLISFIQGMCHAIAAVR
jgi:transposase-like protein